MNRLVTIVLTSLVVVTAPGCVWLLAGAAAGAGGTVYHLGKLKETVNQPVPTVHEAAKKAMEDLKLPLTRNAGDKLTVEMKSEFSDGKSLWVSIQSLTEKSSTLTVRVGLTGDQARSRMVLDAIKKRL